MPAPYRLCLPRLTLRMHDNPLYAGSDPTRLKVVFVVEKERSPLRGGSDGTAKNAMTTKNAKNATSAGSAKSADNKTKLYGMQQYCLLLQSIEMHADELSGAGVEVEAAIGGEEEFGRIQASLPKNARVVADEVDDPAFSKMDAAMHSVFGAQLEKKACLTLVDWRGEEESKIVEEQAGKGPFAKLSPLFDASQKYFREEGKVEWWDHRCFRFGFLGSFLLLTFWTPRK